MMSRITRRSRWVAGWGVLGFLAFCLSAAPAPAQEEPPRWEVAAGETRIVIVARAMGAPVQGEFGEFAADIRFDPDRPEAGQALVVVDMNSFQTANADVEREVKNEKWFDVQSHPEAHFETTAFRALGDDEYEVDGRLTIKGTTKNVTVPFTITRSGGGVAEIQAAFTVRRLDFDVGTGEWTDTNLVSDEIEIRIDARGRRTN